MHLTCLARQHNNVKERAN